MKNFQQFQEATRLKKEMGYDKGGTKKPSSNSRDAVLDAVKKSITAQYGKGVIMRSGSKQEKKVKGARLVVMVSISNNIRQTNNSRKMPKRWVMVRTQKDM